LTELGSLRRGDIVVVRNTLYRLDITAGSKSKHWHGITQEGKTKCLSGDPIRKYNPT
jgi:hypothetical protein